MEATTTMIGDSEVRGPEQEPAPARYLQVWQAVLAMIGSLLLIVGAWVTFYTTMQERLTKIEYQNQISIDDRRDIHNRMDKFDSATSEINQRLARIDTKLDEIRARQNR